MDQTQVKLQTWRKFVSSPDPTTAWPTFHLTPDWLQLTAGNPSWKTRPTGLGSDWGPRATSLDWGSELCRGLCVLEMSGVEEVVCEGWLRKSPPEKKLRRYVSCHLVFSLSADINTQKCSAKVQEKVFAFQLFTSETARCSIMKSVVSFQITQYL